MIKKYLLIAFLFISSSTFCQTEIKTMFYNLLNFPTATPQNRNVILKNILNDYEPDIFMVCELENSTSADEILSFSLSDIPKNYNKATFTPNQSSSGTGSNLQQLVYYNSAYFILDNQEEILTNIRDINHYTFIIKTTDYLTNPIFLEVYVAHLKASQGIANENLRLSMATNFTNHLASLNSNSFVLFAGDFNFYTSAESGYQQILNTSNSIIIKDPLNLNNNLQNWHNNFSWRNIHTQSTRISSSEFNGYGAGGGLDDRFDFILLSENFISNSEINYINNSYKSYGNNGNCFNNRIDNSDCNGTFSQTLRDNLYNMSNTNSTSKYAINYLSFPVLLHLKFKS